MADGERVVVSTYVPETQREVWGEDAEEMDMSLSEFVRCMVQAGRRDFDLEEPQRAALRDDVEAALRDGGLTWAEMATALPHRETAADLGAVLGQLQDRGVVAVRQGGRYELADE